MQFFHPHRVEYTGGISILVGIVIPSGQHAFSLGPIAVGYVNQMGHGSAVPFTSSVFIG
jgi:hypothetical protein